MRGKLGRAPSGAMVVAFVALCVAISGTSYGAEARAVVTKMITGAQIKNGSIGIKDLSKVGAQEPQGRSRRDWGDRRDRRPRGYRCRRRQGRRRTPGTDVRGDHERDEPHRDRLRALDPRDADDHSDEAISRPRLRRRGLGT